MASRHPADHLDGDADEHLTFSDVTMLALLAISIVVLSMIVLLGTVSAIHRIAAVVESL